MPRAARIVIPDIPHHITHRGNHQENIFDSDTNRIEYLRILKQQCIRTGLAIQGWCLMDNHVHLIATPLTPEALSSAIGKAHQQYALITQRLRDIKGQL